MGKDGSKEPLSDAAPRDQAGSPPVFISYASADIGVADAVCSALERERVNCWVAPRDVLPGDFYADAIVRAIDTSKVIILILSQSSATSPHVLREVERATSKRHPLISLRIDQAPPPAALEYFLNTSQWLDATSGGLGSALPKLLTAVRRVIASAPASGPADSAVGRTVDAARATRAGGTSTTPDLLGSHQTGFGRALKRAAVALAALILVVIVWFSAARFWPSPHKLAPDAAPPVTSAAPKDIAATAAVSDKSIAVLPFVDMSEKKDQEYFSDGLSEELIDLLAHSADLKVIARTSSFEFKGKNEDMRTIGQRLGVANLLEGSVRTSGNTVRVTAQLINVSDGSHRWSETYDRDMRDIFKVQDAIATAVVTALKATLALGTPASEPAAVNPDAYKAVLRGRYFREKGTNDDSLRAIGALEDAIKLEPNYAIAFAELARTYNEQGLNGWIAPKEAYAKGHAAVGQALKMDPQLALAHHALASLEWNYARNFPLSRAEDKRAAELDPSSANLVQVAGIDALSRGQPNEAVDFFRQHVHSDPLDALSWNLVGWALLEANRLTEAEAAFRTLLELNPNYAGARCDLAEILIAERRLDAALTAARAETDEAMRCTCLSDALWALGQRTEAQASLVEAQTKYASTQAYEIAQSYALRAEKDQAFKWLGRAYENGEAQITLMRSDRALQSLRQDPRFTELLDKMHLL